MSRDTQNMDAALRRNPCLPPGCRNVDFIPHILRPQFPVEPDPIEQRNREEDAGDQMVGERFDGLA